jgi:glycine/D-amino acid oxidase-like deaminating enzyme
MEKSIGPDAALAVARAGTRAQDAIRAFATAPGRDVWWRENGNLRVSAAPAQDAKIKTFLETARRLCAEDTVLPLSAKEIASRCRSPVFRAGLYFPEGATVHPARLARALRLAVIAAGVSVFENTPMLRLHCARPNQIETPQGKMVAREVVLATGVELAANTTIKPHVTVFSSYALITEPAHDELNSLGWTGGEGLADLRMFLHYFRTTVDGRVLMGSGSGPISYGGDTRDPALTLDRASAARAERGLRRLLPALDEVPVARTWGGAIDVSSDRLPIFGTFANSRIHYGCGYSGHGVNATYIGAQCLASLVLGDKDEWSALPLCTRPVPSLPPEPLRTLGGRAVRWGILACEEAEERSRKASLAARVVAALPRALGLRIGTR